MPLLKEQVEHIARLARLNLTPREIEKIAQELTTVVDYFDLLKVVATEGVEPRNQFTKAENVFREDEVRPSLPRKMALRNAPNSDGEYFRVPKVIG